MSRGRYADGRDADRRIPRVGSARSRRAALQRFAGRALGLRSGKVAGLRPPPDLWTWDGRRSRLRRGARVGGWVSSTSRIAVDRLTGRPLRVAFFTTDNPLGHSGIDRYTSDLLRELVKRDDLAVVPVASAQGAAWVRAVRSRRRGCHRHDGEPRRAPQRGGALRPRPAARRRESMSCTEPSTYFPVACRARRYSRCTTCSRSREAGLPVVEAAAPAVRVPAIDGAGRSDHRDDASRFADR